MKQIAELITGLQDVAPVTWDRYTEKDGTYDFYGWIQRKDGQRDFVAINAYMEGEEVRGSFLTSSAKYSKKISEYMYGDSAVHNKCKHVISFVSEYL